VSVDLPAPAFPTNRRCPQKTADGPPPPLDRERVRQPSRRPIGSPMPGIGRPGSGQRNNGRKPPSKKGRRSASIELHAASPLPSRTTTAGCFAGLSGVEGLTRLSCPSVLPTTTAKLEIGKKSRRPYGRAAPPPPPRAAFHASGSNRPPFPQPSVWAPKNLPSLCWRENVVSGLAQTSSMGGVVMVVKRMFPVPNRQAPIIQPRSRRGWLHVRRCTPAQPHGCQRFLFAACGKTRTMRC